MGSARRSLCAAMLVLQAVALGLTTPVLIGVADVDVAVALWVGPGLAAGCLLTAGMLPSRPGGHWSYGVGWALQVASVGLGFVITMMFLLGIVFGSLWAGAYLLGARIDSEKAQRPAPG